VVRGGEGGPVGPSRAVDHEAAPAIGRLAVGIDLGGTTLSGLLIDESGRVMARRRRATPAMEGPAAVLAAVRDTAAELLGEARALGAAAAGGMSPGPGALREIAGLGLGIPGPIDVERGVCLFSPNLGWRELDVASYFRQAFDLPVRLDNDVRAATLGEAWLGAGRPYATFVCLTVGTGIGAGIMLEGRLWRGPGWSAGEIGHIPVDGRAEAPLCGCGRRGCLEAVASGTAIARQAAMPSAREVAEAARRGERRAGEILRQAATYLGLGIATAVTLFNPEAVIVGGGVAGAWDLIGPTVGRMVKERTFPPNLVGLRGVFPAALGEDAGAIGAASLVLDGTSLLSPAVQQARLGKGASA
jgi:glucokinase